MLIEGLCGDAVRVPFHDERSIGEDGQEKGRYANVVAEQIAFCQLAGFSRAGPKDLAEIAELETITVRQFEDTAAAAIFDGIELCDELVNVRVRDGGA
jgi:hypothetical protein